MGNCLLSINMGHCLYSIVYSKIIKYYLYSIIKLKLGTIHVLSILLLMYYRLTLVLLI